MSNHTIPATVTITFDEVKGLVKALQQLEEYAGGRLVIADKYRDVLAQFEGAWQVLKCRYGIEKLVATFATEQEALEYKVNNSGGLNMGFTFKVVPVAPTSHGSTVKA